MTTKIKLVKISSIVFTAIIFLLFFLVTYLTIEILIDVSKYIENETSNTLSIGLGFAFFIILSLGTIIPLILNFIINIMGIKRNIKTCKICMILTCLMFVLNVLYFFSIIISARSKGIVLLN